MFFSVTGCRLLHSRFFEFLSWVERTERVWTNWDIFFKDLDWQSFNKYQCKHWSTRTISEVPRYSQYCRLLHSRFFEFLSWVERTERVWTNWDIFFKDLDWQSLNKYQCKHWRTRTNSEVPSYSQYLTHAQNHITPVVAPMDSYNVCGEAVA